jgi:hypothetical protein
VTHLALGFNVKGQIPWYSTCLTESFSVKLLYFAGKGSKYHFIWVLYSIGPSQSKEFVLPRGLHIIGHKLKGGCLLSFLLM